MANAKTVSSEVVSEINNDGEGTKDSAHLVLPLAAASSLSNRKDHGDTGANTSKSIKSNGGNGNRRVTVTNT